MLAVQAEREKILTIFFAYVPFLKNNAGDRNLKLH
jgi:hypothetical protein